MVIYQIEAGFRLYRRGADSNRKQIIERGITVWAEAEVHTAEEAIPEAGLSADVQAAVSAASVEAEEVPEDLDLEGRDSAALHREVLDLAAQEDGDQDGADPAEDGAVPYFREAVSDGEARAAALRSYSWWWSYSRSSAR